jgi:hypothetical protein
MVIEIEKELVAARAAASASGDKMFVASCVLSGVFSEVSSSPYAPDVNVDSEEEVFNGLVRMIYDKDTPVKHARLIRLYLAAKGHVHSQFIEAVNFREGRNIAQNDEVARYWMEKAAENGSPGAQNDLGVMCSNGIGGEEDPEKAVYWYMKSAESGDVVAKGNLGQNLAQGVGIKRNYMKAAKLLKESLRADPYNAWNHLLIARCYEHGVGGRNGRRLAIYHYQEASDFGSPLARAALRRLKAGVEKPQPAAE